MDKLEKQCRTEMRKLWRHKQLNPCPKLGSWKRRSAGLLNEVSRIQNICLKRQRDQRNIENDVSDSEYLEVPGIGRIDFQMEEDVQEPGYRSDDRIVSGLFFS